MTLVSCASGLEEWLGNVVICVRPWAIVLALIGGAFCVVHKSAMEACACGVQGWGCTRGDGHWHNSVLRHVV